MLMTPDEDRITQLYEAFNRRAFDRCIAMLAPDVSWPDELEDRRLEGLDAVRAYLDHAIAPLRVCYQPIALFTPSPGQIEVLARQTVLSATDGSLWSSLRVRHRYTIKDGLFTHLESEQNYTAPTFEGVDRLLRRLYDAINAGDVEGAAACFGDHACFEDKLEDGPISGPAAIRAHFEHLFATLQVTATMCDYALEPDDRVRVRLQVEARGATGRLWHDGGVTAWYRLEGGLIVGQDVDDSGEEAP
ncbi:hypothetical protein EIB18_06490 [Caulobacter vibrioides]|uniref:nuclear transport factor 2 family protein n=1 Tax=Caulobacter vibrioides TaxID=155892 RepID=UPI000BB4C272|nr:nuclear transport factor 2 family protein [Caulobacter vibrioides]ATC24148.1 hypothetical protein CA608_06220 [Caulobacter vibrioides]AZH12394.1 hypothetical protein EIB18_06490 [Caulobacter vibrioides]PLR08417.1 hypothetical protein CVUC_17525 [Caulobacter vibrioides]